MVWYPETFQMKKGSENEDENAKCMTIFCISQSAIFVTKNNPPHTYTDRQRERTPFNSPLYMISEKQKVLGYVEKEEEEEEADMLIV